MQTDIEIAQMARPKPIQEVAQSIGLYENEIEEYGDFKAKLRPVAIQRLLQSKKSKIILVTAITPTKAGEGKSTVSIGLADGMKKAGYNVALALREPSLGPVFGVKGGACGGGYSQVIPMVDINLAFTGDIPAITAANNLLSSMIDNSLQYGNPLDIDPKTITWKRCIDLNDRCLRQIVIGLGGKLNGVVREDSFCISVASEIMAIICLSCSLKDLKEQLGNITVAQDRKGRLIKAKELGCVGAMATILRNAIRPNLVQTLEGTPAFIHGGPFANIAHGCNSILATKCAASLADYVITEAGFAADLGAEKFFDIKCRLFNITPDIVVITATVRALKMHGGIGYDNLATENIQAVEKGFANLKVHIENIREYGMNSIVAINVFATDTQKEIQKIIDLCNTEGVKACVCNGYLQGSMGTQELANMVHDELSCNKSHFKLLYPDNISIEEKIKIIAKKIYRARDVEFSKTARKKIDLYQTSGYGNLPICIAKTQNSISHDPKLLGAPSNYIFPIKDLTLCSGAGFIVAMAGDIVTMPGLPKAPASLNIDINNDGVVSGLF